MTVQYNMGLGLPSPAARARLVSDAPESEEIVRRLGGTRLRLWAPVAGGEATGGFVVATVELPSAEAALTFHDRWNADSQAQALRARADAPMVLGIDVLHEIDLGTGADTPTPSVGLALHVTPKQGARDALIDLMGRRARLARDALGATSCRLHSYSVAGPRTGTFVQISEFADLASVGRFVDAFADSANGDAAKLRAAFEAADGPIASSGTFVVEELAHGA